MQMMPASYTDSPVSLRRAKVDGAATSKKASDLAKKTYGERLRELRERAGVTGNFLSEKLGFSAPGAYYRYENAKTPKDAGSRPIPYETVIKPIGIFLVGKGTPPVTWDELLAISSIANLPEELTQAQRTNPRTGVAAPDGSVLSAFAAAQTARANSGLPVRWVVQAEMFMRASKLEDPPPATIVAPLLPSQEFPISAQFACRVGDDHALPLASPGDTLHCVEPAQFGMQSASGKTCVFFSETSGGLGELLIGRAVVEREALIGVSMGDGSKPKGPVVGIVIRKLSEC
jgi:hypothetical protein